MNTTRTAPPVDLRRAFRLAEELTAELQRCEHHEADLCGDGWDASDHLTDIRAARDKAIDARDILSIRLPG